MINPLKAATGGYLKRTTKAVLIIAVAGYLNFGGTPPPIPPDTQGGGYGGSSLYESDNGYREKIEKQNNLVIAICKAYIECQL